LAQVTRAWAGCGEGIMRWGIFCAGLATSRWIDAACREEPEAATWQDIKERIVAYMPKLEGRRKPVAFAEDVKIVESIGHFAERARQDCILGQLTARLFSFQFMEARHNDDGIRKAYDRLNESGIGWTELLESGWPIFQLLSNLQYSMVPSDPVVEPIWGLIRAARPLDEVNELLPMPLNDGTCETCEWIGHEGTFLMGYASDEMYTSLAGALSACTDAPKCYGVTQGIEESGDELLEKYTLRSGEVLLLSPSGERSYVKRCHTTCADPTVLILVEAEKALRGNNGLNGFQPELIAQAQDSVGGNLLESPWPVYGILGRIQQLIDSRTSFEDTGEVLRLAIGFTDHQWGLIGKQWREVSPLPRPFVEGVKCSDPLECAKELASRIHVMSSRDNIFPRGDPVLIGAKDYLAKVYIQSEKWFERGDDDWQKGAEAAVMYDVPTNNPVEVPSYVIDEMMPDGQALVVDRRQAAAFVVHCRNIIQRNSPVRPDSPRLLNRCIEWDSPFYVIKGFGDLCTYTDIFTYASNDPPDGGPGTHEYPRGLRHYWGDLMDLQGSIPDGEFDVVVASFVFGHIPNPFLAIKELFKIVSNGGWVIWGAPFFAQFHGIPNDYQRYTPSGLAELAYHAGFEITTIYAPGDLKLAAGALQGLMSPYWTHEEMLEDVDGAHPLNVFALLRKPLDGKPAPRGPPIMS